jgi:UDP-galactopyranose mutase
MIYTGPIDYFFDYKYGKLPYRSIKFEFKNYSNRYLQACAVYNYVQKDVEFTRVCEYKHLTNQPSDSSTLSYEYPSFEGEPFYPIPTEENKRLYSLYKKESEQLKTVIFCGRLAEYQYYNMNQVIVNSLNIIKRLKND